MNELRQNYPLTFEGTWAAIQESNRYLTEKQVENERYLKEQLVESRRLFNEARVEREKREKEREKEREKDRKDYERRMKKMEETMGAWANNIGSFAEEYFTTSFENGKQNFFGEEFDEIETNLKGIKKGYRDEYDILLINGKSIGIIEVKSKAHENDVPKVLKKAKTFRVNFTEYENHQVYLGLATLVFYPELEQLCIDEGIAVIKLVGDTVVINDGHLKVF